MLGTGTSSTARILSSSNGRALGTSPGSSNQQSKIATGSSISNPLSNVRDVWNKRFSATPNNNNQTNEKSDAVAEIKPTCLLTPLQSNWVVIDDDILIQNVNYETVTILDDSKSDDSSTGLVRQSSDEVSIKREIMNSFGDEDITDSDIELIDHDYDDNEGASVDGLCDKKITDNLFSWNKSTEDLNKIHMTDDENAGNPDKELVACPVCNTKCERESMSDHLDGCLGLTRKIDPRRAVKPPIRTKKSKKSPKITVTTSTSEEEEFNRRILSEMEAEARSSSRNPRTNAVAIDNDAGSTLATCPVCLNSIKASEINDHLDICLSC